MPSAIARSEIAAALATAMASELGSADAALIGEAARLQEVGKIYGPDDHFEHGNALARGAGVPDRACAWILHARERWDGGGTTGLAGTDIPLGSRVIAVCREYLDAPAAPAAANGADPRTLALERLRSLAGSVLDPELATLGAELAAPAPDVVVRDREVVDRPLLEAALRERNATRVARNGELVDPFEHPMLLAFDGGVFAGSLTWIDDGDEVEILQLFATERRQGVGTALVEELADRSARLGRRSLFAITTNDNVDALRFYQRRGFRLRALRPRALEDARARLKPSLPTDGDYGIYKRDELELERALGA